MPASLVDYKNASILDLIKLYGYITKLSLNKKNRDFSLIDKEYNSGIWNRRFEEIEFESSSGNFKRKDLDDLSIFPVSDKLLKISRRDYDKKSGSEFLSFFKNFSTDSIIELCCGLGHNLFRLYNSGIQNLTGCDLSINAINNLKKYVKMKKINIDFDVCNLNDELPKNLIEGKIVFTNACLEQCKHIMPTVLQNIVNGKPKLVINFEVDYESSSYMVRKYFDAVDYQNNLVKELKQLEKNEKIEILSRKPLEFSGTPTNRRSAIIWVPKY